MPVTIASAPAVAAGAHGGSGSADPRQGAVVDALVEARRMIARLQATEAMLLAAAYDLGVEQIATTGGSGDPDRDIPLRSLAAQIGAATRTSDRTVGVRMADAAAVRELFPQTLAAQAAGEITEQHRRVVVDAGVHLDDATARAAYEADALAVARRETPGRTRPIVRRLAERHAPRTLAERHGTARAGRDVRVHDADDGMAVVTAHLPATLAHAAFDRISTMARTMARTMAGTLAEGPDADTRTQAQLRADVFADLLLTGHPTAVVTDQSPTVAETVVAHVQVVIPVATLLGVDHPGELAGRAVIDAATARLLAGTATRWDRLFVRPDGGTVLAVDRYRPSDQQRRVLAARDAHCRFPGCRVSVRRCDIDHTVAAAHDGPTEIANLAHLCRRHQTLKHHSAWRVRQLADGTLEWTTPTGRRHRDVPARVLEFTSDGDPPPF
jgi:hypothetical protein